MRINDVKLAFPIVDRDIEQCAIIKIIAVVEVREIVRKLTGPKTWMCHRGDQVAIRPDGGTGSRLNSERIASFALARLKLVRFDSRRDPRGSLNNSNHGGMLIRAKGWGGLCR